MTSHDPASEISAVDLADFDVEFQDAEVSDSDFAPPPDGKYQAVVDRVELTRSRNGSPMLKWCLRIVGPQYAGRLLWRNNVFGQGNMRFLKNDLHRCGVELTKASELPSRLAELLDLALEVTVRTKDENTNVFINKRLDSVPSAGSELTPF